MSGDLHRRLAEAVRRVLPVDPDDGTVVVRFTEHDHPYERGPVWAPTWGPADTMVELIVDAVLGVVEPPAPPVPDPPPVPRVEGREASVYQLTMRNLADGCDQTTLAVAIAAAVEHGLTYAPEAETTPGYGRWGCGCDARQCQIRWDWFADASSNPHARARATCITHALIGTSLVGQAGDGTRLRAQAMHKLDLAHQEQCR